MRRAHLRAIIDGEGTAPVRGRPAAQPWDGLDAEDRRSADAAAEAVVRNNGKIARNR